MYIITNEVFLSTLQCSKFYAKTKYQSHNIAQSIDLECLMCQKLKNLLIYIIYTYHLKLSREENLIRYMIFYLDTSKIAIKNDIKLFRKFR